MVIRFPFPFRAAVVHRDGVQCDLKSLTEIERTTNGKITLKAKAKAKSVVCRSFRVACLEL